MTFLTGIIAKFESAFKALETTIERLTNLQVTQIYDDIANIVYPIRYNSFGSKHNLMGLISNDAAYATEYGKLFPQPAHPGIYALNINKMKDACLCSHKKEAIHKATISDWEIYEVAKSKTNRFIVRVVTDVWISPLLKWSPTFYAKRVTKELLE